MDSRVQVLRDEVAAVLQENILPFWLERMQDFERGGFYGRMRGDGTLEKDANKGGILNGRILWSFSAAYRVLGRDEYLVAARRAKDYILAYFLDPIYGGTFWELDCHGRPVDTKKQFYAIGFMLYGLTEFLRATISSTDAGERDEVLRTSLHLFHIIERHSLDPEHGGYIEAKTRQWEPIADMRLSELDANYPKSQNTHLHVLEPYTNLLRCLREMQRAGVGDGGAIAAALPEVEASLRGLIGIFTDRILNPATHHLDLFFEMDWTRGAGWLESYGHDIECSWLMHEAALVLGDGEVTRHVEPIVQQVAKASEKGLNADGSMTHEANLDTGHVDDDRHWWVQAEAVVGFYNIYQHFADATALDKALRCWQYIKDNLIDNTLGEWYWSRDKHGHLNTTDDHAGFWKCPYHNSRMCLEIMERVGEKAK